MVLNRKFPIGNVARPECVIRGVWKSIQTPWTFPYFVMLDPQRQIDFEISYDKWHKILKWEKKSYIVRSLNRRVIIWHHVDEEKHAQLLPYLLIFIWLFYIDCFYNTIHLHSCFIVNNNHKYVLVRDRLRRVPS